MLTRLKMTTSVREAKACQRARRCGDRHVRTGGCGGEVTRGGVSGPSHDRAGC